MPAAHDRDEAHGNADASREVREREWIDGVRTSDIAAFDAMFVAYADKLCGFVYTYLHSRAEAQELVQDLFLWIWEHRAEWEVPGTLRKYLFKSARNRAISHLRHRRVEQRLDERLARDAHATDPVTVTPPPDQLLAASELERLIDRAIAALPDRCREVFALSRRHGFGYADIAELLGISPKTVEIHMGRAFAAIRGVVAAWQARPD
jgi:RNA polymerase sigma-70 factor, ECF subfamily